jgi:hypothetical protein
MYRYGKVWFSGNGLASVQISVETPAILTEAFSDFPQALEVNAKIVFACF